MCKVKTSTAFEVAFYNFKAFVGDWSPMDYNAPTFKDFDEACRYAESKLDDFYKRAVESGEFEDVYTCQPEFDFWQMDVYYRMEGKRYSGAAYIYINPIVSCDYEF